MTYRERFGVPAGAHVHLADIDPDFTDTYKKKSDATDQLERDRQELHDLQYRLYAENKRSVLVVLQGPDASGKDGTVSHVFGALNPQGARVKSFKTPTAVENAHDFLWRAHLATPHTGEFAIFNRSHYEDVLIVRVHNLVPESEWSQRYDLINAFEQSLALAGTTILKFYLHISEDEQLSRFGNRLEDPMRQWKISNADYTERAFFPHYNEAYEAVFHKTSTAYAPWYIIPSNRKWFRNLAVSKIVVETLEDLDLTVPPTTVNLDEIKQKYYAAKSKS